MITPPEFRDHRSQHDHGTSAVVPVPQAMPDPVPDSSSGPAVRSGWRVGAGGAVRVAGRGRRCGPGGGSWSAVRSGWRVVVGGAVRVAGRGRRCGAVRDLPPHGRRTRIGRNRHWQASWPCSGWPGAASFAAKAAAGVPCCRRNSSRGPQLPGSAPPPPPSSRHSRQTRRHPPANPGSGQPGFSHHVP